MNLNKVQLIGRLTRDPEIRTTPSGQTVATVGLATNRTWMDKAGQKQEKTEFHNIVIWGRLAEIAGQYLTKGQEAYFEGRLETRSYTGKDGVERKVTDIVAENMQMGSRAQGSGQGGGSYQTRQAQQTSPAPANKPAPTQEENIPTINLDEETDEVRLEDVPF
ncbi:MAG: single-stranded DNA-binding protein [Candidatus Moranbacteria bacterium]|nr:single-stranded DNA-binding protein [Candidatus Moranbacteria bacterium]